MLAPLVLSVVKTASVSGSAITTVDIGTTITYRITVSDSGELKGGLAFSIEYEADIE